LLADSYWQLIGIAICIVLSALFSGSETALTGLHHGRLQQFLNMNRPGTRLLRLWRDKPVTVLSFLLVANNLVNILASSLATEMSLKLLTPLNLDGGTSLAIAVSVGVMTFLILVFGEVVPKTLARHNPRLVIHLLPVLLVFYFITWPVAKLFARMGTRFISMAGGDPKSPIPAVTEEELEYLIQQSTSDGSLDSDKEKILSAAFDLEDTSVKEIMIPRTDMVMFDARDMLPRIMQEIADHKFSRYPVFQKSSDKIIGIFYVKDLLSFFQHQDKTRRPFKLREFTKPAFYIPETMPLDTLLKEFQKERVHIAVVVDEYGGTAGLVTLEDVIEELVGEIYDEYDEEETLYTKLDDTTFVVDARANIEDLAKELELRVTFPEDRDYESLGGLLLDLAERVPDKGEVFIYKSEPDPIDRDITPNDLRLEILDADDVKVEKVQLEVMPMPEDSDN
jgi:putative hemolysin